MTAVDFYLIPDNTRNACHIFACRLVEKAYQSNYRIYVHTPSEEVAKTLDDLLWTFRDVSFIPHSLYDATLPAAETVHIGWPLAQQMSKNEGYTAASQNSAGCLLINLTDEVPSFFDCFDRALEIVMEDASSKAVSRKKYQLYRERNCDLKIHPLHQNNTQ